MQTQLEIRCTRKTVEFSYGGKSFVFRRSTGMIYLIELLANAGQQINAEALTRLSKHDDNAHIEISEANLTVNDCLDTPVPYCDEQTVREVKRRLLTLTQEYAEALEWRDLARLDALRSELEGLEDYLRAALGAHGQIRKLPNASRRARAAVNRALVRAIQQIAEADLELAQGLRQSLRMWHPLSYVPSEDLPIRISYCD